MARESKAGPEALQGVVGTRAKRKDGDGWRGSKGRYSGRTANISQKNRSLHRSDLQIFQLLRDPSSSWDHIVKITGSRQSTDHKLPQPPSLPPLCLKLIFSSTIAKSLKSIHWPSTTSQLSLHGHQGCSPRLFSKAGVWSGRSSDLACLSLSLCLLYPSALRLLSPLLKCFLFIIVRWSLNATSSGSLSCLLPAFVVTLCGKTQPNGTKGAQTIAICLQTQLPQTAVQTAVTSQTMCQLLCGQGLKLGTL